MQTIEEQIVETLHGRVNAHMAEDVELNGDVETVTVDAERPRHLAITFDGPEKTDEDTGALYWTMRGRCIGRVWAESAAEARKLSAALKGEFWTALFHADPTLQGLAVDVDSTEVSEDEALLV